MTDYLKQRQEFLRMIEKSTGVNYFRSIEENIQRAVEPWGISRAELLGDAFAQFSRGQELPSTWLESFVDRDWASKALGEVLRISTPASYDSLVAAMGLHDDVFGYFTRDALRATRESLGAVESIRRSVLDDAALGATFTYHLSQELGELRAAVSALTGSSAVVIATALEGWHSLVNSGEDGDPTLLANPFLEGAREVRRSATILARELDPTVRRAVETSVALGDLELRTAQAVVANFGPAAERAKDVPARRLFVPRRQRLELRKYAARVHGLDLDSTLFAIPVGGLVLLSREVVSIVAAINELVKFRRGGDFFKLTTRLLRVVAELPFALAVDERTLADVADDLYWLLYESAGSGSLRYLDTNGGPFQKTDCDIVFFVKRLRNHLRHDPEHGSESDIRKKFDSLREDLARRGFSQLPSSRESCGRLHRMLIEETLGFLRVLRERLESDQDRGK